MGKGIPKMFLLFQFDVWFDLKMFYYTMFRRTNVDVILSKIIENPPILVELEKSKEEKYLDMIQEMQNDGGKFKQVRKEWFTRLLNVCRQEIF